MQKTGAYEELTKLICEIGPYWYDRQVLHKDGDDIDKLKTVYDRLCQIRELCEKPVEQGRGGSILDNLPYMKDHPDGYYQTYDDYDAINCDKTADIPVDYEGAIGVPITVFDRPEIIRNVDVIGSIRPKIGGRYKYERVLIRWKWSDMLEGEINYESGRTARHPGREL